MGDGGVKGSVTPLASVFSAEEAQKAARRVEDAISDRRKELDSLRLFAADNANLINLVQRMPDELSHDIMVPFGKAAFFPGRLIHTNEFLVLLGEGYYADRTAKQTVEILQRRGNDLDSQVESLKSMMMDLQAEAKFFDATASEAAEGLMEIREEYIEEPQTDKKAESGIHLGASKAGKTKIIDEEYARIEARLDELEKEELAAEYAGSDDEDENVEAGFEYSASQHPFDDGNLKISLEKQLKELAEKSKGKETLPITTTQSSVNFLKQAHAEESSSKDLNMHFGTKEDSVHSKGSEHTVKQSQTTERSPVPAKPKELVQEVPLGKSENFPDDATGQTTRMDSHHRKAFTDSIIEHSHGLPSNMSTQSSTQFCRHQVHILQSQSPDSRCRRGALANSGFRSSLIFIASLAEIADWSSIFVVVSILSPLL